MRATLGPDGLGTECRIQGSMQAFQAWAPTMVKSFAESLVNSILERHGLIQAAHRIHEFRRGVKESLGMDFLETGCAGEAVLLTVVYLLDAGV